MAWKTIEQRIEMFKESMKVSRTDTIVEALDQTIAELEIDLENEKLTEQACQCSGKPYMPAWVLKLTGISMIYFTLYYIDVLLGGLLIGC